MSPPVYNMTTTLVQDGFKSAYFSVSSNSQVSCSRYDIRVVTQQIGTPGENAVTTITRNENFTISSASTKFQIPVVNTMSGLYKATLRLYSAGQVVHMISGLFYYESREITTEPIVVTSNPDVAGEPGEPATFSNSKVVLVADETPLDPAADELDPFFSFFKINNVALSATNIIPSYPEESDTPSFIPNGEYYLGEQTNADVQHWALAENGLQSDHAYELWGSLNIALADSFVVADPLLAPQITFGVDITAADSSVGYYLLNPDVSIVTGDVDGAISANPIVLTLNNENNYSTYPFQSVVLKIWTSTDVETRELIIELPSKPVADFNNNELIYTSEELSSVTNGGGLINGDTYYFETILVFDDTALYVPTQERSSIISGFFSDKPDSISISSAVNSWQLASTEIGGVVITFKKPGQFLGNDNAFDFNMDLNGITKVKVEFSYEYDDETEEWMNWALLTGGSIAQGSSPNYSTSNNADGLYLIPKYTEDDTAGPDQPDVYIYAALPVEYKTKLFKFRLTVVTDIPVYSTTNSDTIAVAPVDTATYPTADASFRYIDKPDDHSFDDDQKPYIVGAGDGSITYSVPLNIPPLFHSNIVADGVSYDDNSITNDSLNTYLTSSVDTLTYEVDGAEFDLVVTYICTENSAITTNVVSKTFKKQGFPIQSTSFSIESCVWDAANQQVDYVLTVSATDSTSDRMDGYTLYVKSENEDDSSFVDYGNFLNDGNLSRSFALNSPGYPNYTVLVVKFVATRSVYLDSEVFSTQVDSVSGVDPVFETASITKIPADLPSPTSADISLSYLVYNAAIESDNQAATLEVTLPNNVIGVRIINLDDESETDSTSLSISLPSEPTSFSFSIAFAYANGDSSIYSDPVTVSFTSSTSNRVAPTIVSKSISNQNFVVVYNSSNNGDYSTGATLQSNDILIHLPSATDLGTSTGTLNLSFSSYAGTVSLQIKDTFTSSYTVGGSSVQIDQVIESDAVTFVLADNPRIVEGSIVVSKANDQSTIAFDVELNGCDVLNHAVVTTAQDATTNESDVGYYEIGVFNNTEGFELDVNESNQLVGDNTLKVTSVTESGMDAVAHLVYTSSEPFANTPANVVIYVANNSEGGDSAAVANQPIIQ
jgi:hypothetical protein